MDAQTSGLQAALRAEFRAEIGHKMNAHHDETQEVLRDILRRLPAA